VDALAGKIKMVGIPPHPKPGNYSKTAYAWEHTREILRKFWNTTTAIAH
jgi:hypothetical protein